MKAPNGTPRVTVWVEDTPGGDRITNRYHPCAHARVAEVRAKAPDWLATALLISTGHDGAIDLPAALAAVRVSAQRIEAVGDKPCKGHLRALPEEP